MTASNQQIHSTGTWRHLGWPHFRCDQAQIVTPDCHICLSYLVLLFQKVPAAVLMLLLECRLRAKGFTVVAHLPIPVLLLPFQSPFFCAHQQLIQMMK